MANIIRNMQNVVPFDKRAISNDLVLTMEDVGYQLLQPDKDNLVVKLPVNFLKPGVTFTIVNLNSHFVLKLYPHTVINGFIKVLYDGSDWIVI